MKVSIITVVWNGGETIEDAIQSVAAQSHPDIEHIIIDGKSTDNTLGIIDKYKESIGFIVSEKDSGIYDAMNKGVKIATGDIVGMLNADDILNDEHVIRDIVDTFEHNETIDACHGDLVYVGKLDVTKVKRYWKSREILPDKDKYNIPAHPTFYCRRNIYEQYGLYDTNYPLAADFELMYRFINKYKVLSKYIPRVLVRMREGGATNKSIQNIIKQNLEILKAIYRQDMKINIFKFIYNKLLNRISQYTSDEYNHNG